MKIRVLVASLLICLFALSLLGCGGSKSTAPARTEVTAQTGPCPIWYTVRPEDPNFEFGAATETSKDLQMAVDKAKLSARAELAEAMNTLIQRLATDFREEIGLAEESEVLRKFTQATKGVVDQTITGSRVRETSQVKEGTVWRACVLMELPQEIQGGAILNTISKDEEMYTRFRESETFKALDAAVKDKRAYESSR